MVLEVKEFAVTNRYNVNEAISVDNVVYLVLECNQYILPKYITNKITFVVKCVVADLVKQI